MNTPQTPKTPQQVAALFRCTVDQARAQIKKTAESLRAGAVKAGNGKYRGWTAAEWTARAEAYEQAATA